MLTLGLAAPAFAKTHRGEYEYARTIADEAVEIGLETACVSTANALLARGNLAFCEGDFQRCTPPRRLFGRWARRLPIHRSPNGIEAC